MSFIFSRFINKQTRCIKSNLIVNKYIHTFTKKINNYTIKFTIKEPLSEHEINKMNSFFSKSKLKITDNYYNNFDISYENNNIIKYKILQIFAAFIGTSTVIYISEIKEKPNDLSDIILTLIAAYIFPTSTLVISGAFLTYHKFYSKKESTSIL